MPQRIQAPDGSIVEFPDGMTDEQIAGVMRQEFGGKDTRETSQTLGILKGVLPVAKKVAGYSPANIFPGFHEKNEAALPRLEKRVAERELTQKPGAVGQIGGSLMATAPVMMATRNPFIAGAGQGALLSEADSPAGQALDAGSGAILNWAGGKAVNLFADAIKPIVAPAVKRLHEAGVRLTPGMVKGEKAMVREDKMMSRPVVGDTIAAGRQATQATFNTAAVNRALQPLGKKVPTVVKPGNDSIAYAKDEITRAYDLVIPNLSVRINGPQFAQAVYPAAQNLRAAQQKQLQQIISNELGAGQLQGQTLKAAQANIRRLAGKFRRSQDANDQMLGEALGTVDDELTSAMLAQNPKWAPQLQKVNEAYRGYRIVADAAGRADDGLFSTGQLRDATRRGDFSKAKDATARGQAFMQDFSQDARAVIPARSPNPSGTASHMQAANLFANLGGAKDRFVYGLDDAYQQFRLAPRPAGASRVADEVRRLRAPAGAAAIAAAQETRR